MTPRKKRRCFYELNDRRAKVLDLTPASLAIMNERHRCPGNACPNLSPHWHNHPEPINIVVDRVAPAWVEKVAGIDLFALQVDLVDVIEPYSHDMLFGKVSLDDGSGGLQSTHFSTVTAPADRRIQSDRGRHCRHMRWNCCDVFQNKIGWASGAIVEHTLDDRLVYINEGGWVLVADELVERLELKRRFPKLWLYRIDVIPEPLDGEVLPGDPSWDGVFRQAPPPVMPEGMPKGGRVTHD